VRQWKSLKGRIDEPRYLAVLAALEYQAGHAQVWRDAVNTWFLRTSGIPDLKGRAGLFPGRYEAEAMELAGYMPVEVERFEAASGSKAIACNVQTCTASMRFDGRPGWYDISVRYFDQNDGVARFRLLVNDQVIEEWVADDKLPTSNIDSHSSTRRVVSGVALRPGDTIRVEGTPEGADRAGLDYIEILRGAGLRPATAVSTPPRPEARSTT
jgi:alpha-glucuronidase